MSASVAGVCRGKEAAGRHEGNFGPYGETVPMEIVPDVNGSVEICREIAKKSNLDGKMLGHMVHRKNIKCIFACILLLS